MEKRGNPTPKADRTIVLAAIALAVMPLYVSARYVNRLNMMKKIARPKNPPATIGYHILVPESKQVHANQNKEMTRMGAP